MDHVSPTLPHARLEMQRVAAHVLARRRWEITGRFGLRVSPGGIATPPFGPDGEQLRVAGGSLVHERDGRARYMGINGASLAALATFAGADLAAEFECGSDTPAVGDVDRPIEVLTADLDRLAGWYLLGSTAIDHALAELEPSTVISAMQLWPEHFDVGCTVTFPGGEKANLGCSPGDDYSPVPYMYVGPWSAARPGDPTYWNAPFGAALACDALPSEGEAEAIAAFIAAGTSLLRSS